METADQEDTVVPRAIPVGGTPPVARAIPTGRSAAPPSASSFGPDGRTYSVPDYADAQLDRMQSRIESLSAALEPDMEALERLRNQIDTARPLVNVRSQAALNAFNEKVQQHSQLKRALQPRVDELSRAVHAYNAELKRVGNFVR